MKKLNKVMILDDSRMVLQISKDIIEKNLVACDVRAVLDAKEAKTLLLGRDYEVLILDIVMPGISGIDVLKWIRDQPALAYLKVIIFTSLEDTEALTDCFRLGAYDFITKPFEENEFIARLEHALNDYALEEIVRDNFLKVHEMNDELLHLNKALKETQLALLQKDRLASIGHLAAGMAHEVNNPLGFLSSNISTLEGNVTSVLDLYGSVVDEIKRNGSTEGVLAFIEKKAEACNLDFIVKDTDELFSDVKHGLHRIHLIVEALRKFSVEDVGSGEEPISISDTVETILTMIQERMADHIKIEKSIEVNAMVTAKKADFNLSVLSLVDNAIDAIQSKENLGTGTIVITIRAEGSEIHMTINDDGIGMDSEVLKHAWDPFFTTKDVGDGVGLGLSSAHNCFVKSMNGRMTIESKVGSGTKVCVCLPKWEMV